jgi:hypothetical protein
VSIFVVFLEDYHLGVVLQHPLQSKSLPSDAKKNITWIRLAVLYASEAWSTTKQGETLLPTFENSLWTMHYQQ